MASVGRQGRKRNPPDTMTLEREKEYTRKTHAFV